jgi:hypothetical protein
LQDEPIASFLGFGANKVPSPYHGHKSEALRLSPMIYRRLINLTAPEVREFKYIPFLGNSITPTIRSGSRS